MVDFSKITNNKVDIDWGNPATWSIPAVHVGPSVYGQEPRVMTRITDLTEVDCGREITRGELIWQELHSSQ